MVEDDFDNEFTLCHFSNFSVKFKNELKETDLKTFSQFKQ